MSKHARIILAFTLLTLVFAQAKSTLLPSLFVDQSKDWMKKIKNIPTYLGTKTPYQSNKEAEYEKPPANCKAVHIGGVHRHGSRFLSKERGMNHAESILKAALEKDELSEKGINLLQWIYDAKKTFKAGHLSSQGEQELYELGRRTYERFPEIFIANNRKINLSATYKERTQHSRDRFQAGLMEAGNIDRSLFEIHTNTRCADLFLRYFDSCQKFVDYRSDLFKKITSDKTAQHETNPENIQIRNRSLEQIFENYGEKSLNTKEAWALSDDIFQLCRQDYCLDSKTGEAKFCSLLSNDLKKIHFQKDNIESYYKIGPMADLVDPKYSKVSHAMACMAVEPLFTEIEKHVRGERDANAAYLGFAHAETVTPLTDYFKLFDENFDKWSASEVTPMGSNIEIVTYECTQEDQKSYKLKLFYNEKEHHFPIEECRKSYFCDWHLVQKFYTDQKIAHGTNSCSLQDWNAYCGNPVSDVPTCTGPYYIDHEEDE